MFNKKISYEKYIVIPTAFAPVILTWPIMQATAYGLWLQIATQISIQLRIPGRSGNFYGILKSNAKAWDGGIQPTTLNTK